MKREISFHTGNGIKLAGELYLPDGKPGDKLAAVILCAGPGGGHAGLPTDVAAWLVREGFAVLRFDYRGFGKSEGPRWRLIPMEQVEDIRSAVTFMGLHTEINPGRIGLWGAATGGANATYTAAIDTRVKAFTSVSAAGDCGRWLRSLRRYWEWVAFLEEIEADRRERVLTGKSRLIENGQLIFRDPVTNEYRAQLDAGAPKPPSMLSLESAEAIIAYRPEDVVDRIAPRAAMWLVAADDTLVPVDESMRMFRGAGEPKKLVVIQGEKHHTIYHGAGFEKMMTECAAWLRKWL
jgi:alpha-beta hydrolase superfamily lysophospholipase